MNIFNPKEIAVTGTTYCPNWYLGSLKSIKHTDKIRGDLILYSLLFATGIGYRVVIVDGGSSKTFQTQIRKTSGVKLIVAKKHKRSPNKRKAVFEASKIENVKAIVMTEIEKVSLITDCIKMIVTPILDDEADIVIPKREDSFFRKSYPDYMYESEVEGNLLYNEELRANGLLSVHDEDLDVFFGARVFRNDKKLLKLIFSKYSSNPFNALIHHDIFDVEEYSSAQFFPVVEALIKKKRVISVTVPFAYPQKQKENEDSAQRTFFVLKRKFQRITLLVELMHFLGYMDRKKTRKIVKHKL